MFRHNRKIDRSYKKPFFSRKQNLGRLYFVVVMLILIFALPIVAIWQEDAIQEQVLLNIGVAPTATPFAGERAAMAEDYYRAGDMANAARYYLMAVEQQPQNISYLYEYGLVLIELDRSEEAVTIGEQMIELDANDPRGYALKANAIAWTNPTEAIPTALTGTEVDYDFPPLHGALATAYTRIGRYTEALREGDLAVRLDVDMNDPNVHRSYSLPLIYTSNYQEAIHQLEIAIGINPNLVGPYFELAALYRSPAINQPEVSVAIFYEILRLQPSNARAYLRLCETYAAAGLFQDAEAFCDAALDIDPNYASAHRMRGQLRYSRRNYEGAIESFQVCLLLYAEQELGRDLVNPVEVENNPNNVDLRAIENSIDLDSLDLNGLEIECIYVRGLAHYFLARGDNCDLAWDWLNRALNHPESIESVKTNILLGLENVTINCPGYSGRTLPTPLPPTSIPPTPIGGF
jgi:tetratricopeptide (TPR) repeat protein